MRIAIMQPYFMPYLGYWQHMNSVDCWVAFDDIQFIEKGWINRNRILHIDPVLEWQYITIPLANRGRYDKICEVNIQNDIDWRAQIEGKLSLYKKRAPFYKETIELVKACIHSDEKNLSRMVIRSLKITADYLGIKTPILVQSRLNLELGKIEHPGQWALQISKALSAREYVNPIGGKALFREQEFEAAGIKLSFFKAELPFYSQHRPVFVPGLSVIDVLMWNEISEIKNYLSKGVLENQINEVNRE